MKGGNYTTDYGGGGPRALAKLIDTLLDDITNPAPDYGAEQPSPGLVYATQEGWKGRTPPFTLTRGELENLRDGQGPSSLPSGLGPSARDFGLRQLAQEAASHFGPIVVDLLIRGPETGPVRAGQAPLAGDGPCGPPLRPEPSRRTRNGRHPG